MKNILIPTDFSPNAQKALDYAAGIAGRCAASLHIIHGYPLLENAFSGGKILRDAYNKNQQEEKTAEMLRIQQYCGERYPNIDCQTHLFTGPAQTVIIQYSREHNIDMLVMGTQGASGFVGKVVVGTVTADIIGMSPKPVLAIPIAYQHSLPTRLLLATRNFEKETALLDPVFELAALFDIPVQVFVFINDSNSDIKIAKNALQLQEYVDFLKKAYPRSSINATFIEGDDFEKAMEEFSDENPAGIICMLTHKRSFLGKFFNPSLTKKMAYQTRVPLLAIPVSG